MTDFFSVVATEVRITADLLRLLASLPFAALAAVSFPTQDGYGQRPTARSAVDCSTDRLAKRAPRPFRGSAYHRWFPLSCESLQRACKFAWSHPRISRIGSTRSSPQRAFEGVDPWDSSRRRHPQLFARETQQSNVRSELWTVKRSPSGSSSILRN